MIFVTEVVSLVVTCFFIRDCVTHQTSPLFSGQIAFWLWFTVLFANFAEAVAEGRGKAQADALAQDAQRHARQALRRSEKPRGRLCIGVNALDLRVGDVVLVEAGDIIPGDGEIIEGVASVNESAITGESAPVIREAGGDRSAVTGGTTVLSDRIKVRITAAPGSTFIDRMIALVEGAERQKTPNELALSILLSGLTLIFLIVCVTLWPLARLFGDDAFGDRADRLAGLPHPDDDRRLAVGDRHRRHGPARALQRDRDLRARGRGGGRLSTRCCSTRPARSPSAIAWPTSSFPSRASASARWPRRRCSPASPTRRRKAARSSRWPRAATRRSARSTRPIGQVVPFSAQTRISGVDAAWPRRCARARSMRSSRRPASTRDNAPAEFNQAVDRIARSGGTPLAVTDNKRLLGVVHLKDIVKPDIRPRFAALRAMGIKTVMVTGDNPLTAAAIASEAGVDDFLAQATPEDKLAYIRKRAAGRSPDRDVRRRHQ